jgi:EAL domain-containing protein (putative c-di-GMP-specific phosphodiesterase class I)
MPETAEKSASYLPSQALLHWQPIIGLENRSIIGMEALLRPEGVTVAAALAEIERQDEWKEFTKWEMERILSDLATLSPSDTPLLVFFNLSPRQCVSEWILPYLPEFPDFMTPVAEVIEEALTRDEMEQLREIRQKGGALVAIDDFGTGHSNVDRLLDLPVDFVKVDRKLIQTVKRFDRDLVEGVASGLGRSDMSLLGEGIETEEHFLFARQIGCTSGQGWHLGRPMPIGKLARIHFSRNAPAPQWTMEPG